MPIIDLSRNDQEPDVGANENSLGIGVPIPMSEIDADEKWNCRGVIIPSSVEELVADIRVKTLMQPIVVRACINGDFKYRIVAGFRRFMAARVLRWKIMPCVIKNVTEEQAAFMNLTENIIRKELDWVQEAHAIKTLQERYPSITEVQMAERLQQSRGWIQIRKYITELPPECQDVIKRGDVTQEQIRIIWQMPDPLEKLRAIKKIKEAKERGMKINLAPKIDKTMSKDEMRHVRGRTDIFTMQHHIQQAVGNNFGTRLLAWCAGEIDDLEIFYDIKNIAQNQFDGDDPRSQYAIPEGPLPKPEL